MLPRKIRLWFGQSELDENGERRIGAWSQSYSGSQYWILDPRPEEVHLVDICAGLANAARYRGQTKFFYPVLTHSIIVSQQAEKIAMERGWSHKMVKTAALQGLLHDASEAYLGDVARPLKRQRVMRGYCRVEKQWEHAIFTRFGIKNTKATDTLVHDIDYRIVLDEIYTVMSDPEMWRRYGRYKNYEPLGVTIPEYTRPEGVRRFYERYQELRS